MVAVQEWFLEKKSTSEFDKNFHKNDISFDFWEKKGQCFLPIIIGFNYDRLRKISFLNFICD